LVVRKEGSGVPVRVELDGRPIEGPYLVHRDLIAAKELVFFLE
jgi:hypothetical protein